MSMYKLLHDMAILLWAHADSLPKKYDQMEY